VRGRPVYPDRELLLVVLIQRSRWSIALSEFNARWACEVRLTDWQIKQAAIPRDQRMQSDTPILLLAPFHAVYRTAHLSHSSKNIELFSCVLICRVVAQLLRLSRTVARSRGVALRFNSR